MAEQYDEIIRYNITNIIDTMQTEFIYELAKQMGYWEMKDEDIYIKESAKFRIEEIYNNVFKTIDNYSKMKDDKQVQKVYKLKKNKINKEFDLKIKE